MQNTPREGDSWHALLVRVLVANAPSDLDPVIGWIAGEQALSMGDMAVLSAVCMHPLLTLEQAERLVRPVGGSAELANQAWSILRENAAFSLEVLAAPPPDTSPLAQAAARLGMGPIEEMTPKVHSPSLQRVGSYSLTYLEMRALFFRHYLRAQALSVDGRTLHEKLGVAAESDPELKAELIAHLLRAAVDQGAPAILTLQKGYGVDVWENEYFLMALAQRIKQTGPGWVQLSREADTSTAAGRHLLVVTADYYVAHPNQIPSPPPPLVVQAFREMGEEDLLKCISSKELTKEALHRIAKMRWGSEQTSASRKPKRARPSRGKGGA